MSAVNITNVAVLDNPSPFSTPLQFEISYECLSALKYGIPSIYLLSLFTSYMCSIMIVLFELHSIRVHFLRVDLSAFFLPSLTAICECMVVKILLMIDCSVDGYAVGELTKKFVVARAPSYQRPIGLCL